MSEETGQAVEPVIETPAAPDYAAMQSIEDYRKTRETADAEPVDAKADAPEPEQPETPDPASEAGKALAGKKKSLQARIDELTREKHDNKREADAARAEAAALKAELAALKTGKPAADTSSAQPESTTPPPVATRPVKPKQSDYEDWDAYEDATDKYYEELASFTAEQKLAAARAESQRAEATRAQHTALERVYTKGREAHADFDAILEQPDLPRWSPLMTQVVLNHESGHDLAYALAKSPADAQRLAELGQTPMAALELGKFIARLETANSGPVSVVAPVTTAPDPIKPVGGSSSGASTADPSEINSIAGWKKARERFL